MKNQILFSITILSFFTLNAYSQAEKYYVTDKISDKYAYIDVMKTYERVAAKGYKSVDLFQKLGNSFYRNSDFKKAANWYRELFAITTDLEPEYYYRYSQCLRSIGDIKKADEMLDLFNKKTETVASIKN